MDTLKIQTAIQGKLSTRSETGEKECSKEKVQAKLWAASGAVTTRPLKP